MMSSNTNQSSATVNRTDKAALFTYDDGALSDLSVSNVESKAQTWWWIGFIISVSMLLCGVYYIANLLYDGLGLWGLNYPVAWAFDITNFVFWIGIGHAGTLISAILFLLRQRFRTSINRIAEAMTLFAVICAFIYPLIHTGRPWYAWWLLPVSNPSATYPQFRSPLSWDVFAIITYFTVSFLFFYIGTLPDFALLRDRSNSKMKKYIYHILSLGWTGSSKQWLHYEKTYILLAALLTPLVVSVHSVVSYDFSVSLLPLWHTTLLPPYFVVGAILSGIGMILVLIIPIRKFYKLEGVITVKHIESLCKIGLAGSCFIGFCYVIEYFGAYYTDDIVMIKELKSRIGGSYNFFFYLTIIGSVLAPQLFWFKKARTSIKTVFVVALLINVGMWSERFVLIVLTLSNGFLPSTSGHFKPTYVDILTFVGSVGLFLTLYLLFLKFIPAIAVAEIKGAKAVVSGTTGDKKIPSSVSIKTIPQKSYLMVGEYDSIDGIVAGLDKIKKTGYKLYEIYSPYPTGIAEKTVISKKPYSGWYAFIGGLIGIALGLFIVWFMNGIDYPLNVSAKPLFNIFLAAPVTFEISILFAAIGAVAGMFLPRNRPNFSNPLFKSERFSTSCSRDKYYISVDSADEKYLLDRTRDMFISTGASNIELIEK